jgi:hypothetical protein
MYYVFRPSVGYNCVKKILVGTTTVSSKEQIHCEFNMCVCFIQHATGHYTAMRGFSVSAIFFDIIS